MKLSTLFAICAATVAAYAPTAMAVDAAATSASVAVVDLQKIMQESSAAKSMREQLEGKQKSFQSELSKKDEQLRKEDQELAKQKGVLSKEAFEKKANEFRKKATDIQKEVQSKRSMLDKAAERALNDIQKVIIEVTGDVAKQKGFSIAVPRMQALYFDTKLDITADVLAGLNSKLPKVDVKFEEAAKPADPK